MPRPPGTRVPIAVSSGLVVGQAAMVVAAVTTLPLARCTNQGAATICAPALVHTAVDTSGLATVAPSP
jgi:hypothetical protein